MSTAPVQAPDRVAPRAPGHILDVVCDVVALQCLAVVRNPVDADRDRVRAVGIGDEVDAGATVQDIRPEPAVEHVVPAGSVDDVCTAVAVQLVVL